MCVRARVSECMCGHACFCVRVRARVHVCIFDCVYVGMYVCACMCVHVCMFVCLYACGDCIQSMAAAASLPTDMFKISLETLELSLRMREKICVFARLRSQCMHVRQNYLSKCSITRCAYCVIFAFKVSNWKH